MVTNLTPQQETELLGENIVMDLYTDVENQYAGKEVVVSYPVDWPDYELKHEIKVEIEVKNETTGQVINDWTDKGVWWWDYDESKGARKTIQMPNDPIRIIGTTYKKVFLQGWVKVSGPKRKTVSLITENGDDGNGGNGDDGNGDGDDFKEWLVTEYYGYPLWMWGVGSLSAVILLNVVSGGRVQQRKPVIVSGGRSNG